MQSYLSRCAPTAHQPLCPSALRTLSATLTFPLTLSYGLRRIFASREVKMETIRVLCLGARAESSLPSVWWAESRRGAEDVLEGQLSISFLGPHLQTHRPPRPLPPGTPTLLTLQHIDQGRSLFHLHPHHMRLLLHTDLFVLFNPGFGATEQLQQQWGPTLQLLLQTRKPVLATAHSARDLARDLAFLEALTNREDEQDLGTLPVHVHPVFAFTCSWWMVPPSLPLPCSTHDSLTLTITLPSKYTHAHTRRRALRAHIFAPRQPLLLLPSRPRPARGGGGGGGHDQ